MKLDKKTLVTALTFLLIGIIITSVVWVYAQPSTTFYISGGVYPQNSYTIWSEGSNIYAKDIYGGLPSWGDGSTNASSVIQNAVNALSSLGKITLLNSMNLDTTVTFPTGQKSIKIEGMGERTTNLTWTGNADEYMFNVTGTEDVTFENFQIYGGETCYGIQALANTMRLNLHRMFIVFCKNLSVHLAGTNTQAIISNCHITNNLGGYEVYVENAVNYLLITGSWIHRLYVTASSFNSYGGGYKHIEIDADESYAHTIEGANFDGVVTGYGSQIIIGRNNNVYHVDFKNLEFHGAPDADNPFIHINRAREVHISNPFFPKHALGWVPTWYINITNLAYDVKLEYPRWLCDATGYGKISDDGAFTELVLPLSKGADLALANGVAFRDVTFDVIQPDTNYIVETEITWDSTVYLSVKTTTTCRVNFGTVTPDANQLLSYVLTR